jgi:hypothetical protein
VASPNSDAQDGTYETTSFMIYRLCKVFEHVCYVKKMLMADRHCYGTCLMRRALGKTCIPRTSFSQGVLYEHSFTVFLGRALLRQLYNAINFCSLLQDRDQCRARVNTVMNFLVP